MSGTWLPTPDNVNALPPGVRDYIHSLEALCDPAYIVQKNMLLQDQVDYLSARLSEELSV